MPAFIFNCPATGLKVQGWTTEEPPAVGYYEAVECTACKAVHFVNPHTGKIVGDRQTPDGSAPSAQ
jgi:hypothetical protein